MKNVCDFIEEVYTGETMAVWDAALDEFFEEFFIELEEKN
jgi:hypothetical protein